MTAALVLAVAVGIGTGGTFIHFYYSNDALTPIVIPWLRVITLVLATLAATGCVVLATLPMVGRSIGPRSLRAAVVALSVRLDGRGTPVRDLHHQDDVKAKDACCDC